MEYIFEVIQDLGEPAQMVRCPKCGNKFVVDPCGEDGLYWSDINKCLKIECPSCNTREV